MSKRKYLAPDQKVAIVRRLLVAASILHPCICTQSIPSHLIQATKLLAGSRTQPLPGSLTLRLGSPVHYFSPAWRFQLTPCLALSVDAHRRRLPPIDLATGPPCWPCPPLPSMPSHTHHFVPLHRTVFNEPDWRRIFHRDPID